MSGEDITGKLSEYFDLLNPSSSYVISFSQFFANNASLAMMKYLEKIWGKNTLYVCIGRPHIFIEKILSSQGVNSRHITFMDMAMYIGRNQPGKEDSTRIVIEEGGEEFQVPAIYKLFRFDQELRSFDLGDIDLVILDNISELGVYNNPEQIRKFLEVYLDLSRNHGKGLFLYHFKGIPDGHLMDTIKDMGMEIIEIPDSVLKT
jgi:hypothetical protein